MLTKKSNRNYCKSIEDDIAHTKRVLGIIRRIIPD